MKRFSIITIVFIVITASSVYIDPVKKEDVRLVRKDTEHKVDVYINGTLFTSYCYPQNIEKPFLFPVNSPDGSVITRGFPVDPRKNERIDHPHHIGLWFNYGNVNGLDFWNNSSSIPASEKDSYGHIVNKKIERTENGKKGILEVSTAWEDNKGNVLLEEKAMYVFSGNTESRTIDHISTLTAVNGNVIFGDSKEGMIAIRVDRAFEMPSKEALIFTDDKGNPTVVKAIDNKGVNGMYFSENGMKGDSVWGTRNSWVILTGTKNNLKISMALFDNPGNPGFPAYAHARGYGLFALNNFGQNAYDPAKEKRSFTLEKGQSVTLYHRFYIQAGSALTASGANEIFKDFSRRY